MNNNDCPSIVISWFFLFSGIYVFELLGLLPAVLLIALGSHFRDKDNDREIASKLLREKLKWATLIYYISLSTYTVFNYQRLANINLAQLIIIISLPFLVAVIISDIKSCVKGRERGQYP